MAAWRNENILLFNPLCLLLLPRVDRQRSRARWRPVAVACTMLSLSVALLRRPRLLPQDLPGSFPQDNRFWIALLLPIHAALAIVALHSPRRPIYDRCNTHCARRACPAPASSAHADRPSRHGHRIHHRTDGGQLRCLWRRRKSRRSRWTRSTRR